MTRAYGIAQIFFSLKFLSPKTILQSSLGERFCGFMKKISGKTQRVNQLEY